MQELIDTLRKTHLDHIANMKRLDETAREVEALFPELPKFPHLEEEARESSREILEALDKYEIKSNL